MLAPTSQSFPPIALPIPPVPAPDSAADVNIADVIGNKLDTAAGSSLYALLKRIDLDHHNEIQCYPSLADGAQVVSANANWAYGAYAQIVPVATIVAADFNIHYVTIEACNKDGRFQLELYYGAADTVFATVRYSVIGGFFGNTVVTALSSPPIPAGSRIRARLASDDGLANQCTQRISLAYTFEA